MSDNPEQDILNELEGIVNDASAQLKSEWVTRSKQLLRSMNDHCDKSDQLSKHKSCVAVFAISNADDSDYDPDRIVGSKDRDLGESLGSVSHLLTLPKASFIKDFFNDHTAMVLTQAQYNVVGYYARAKMSSGRRISYYVSESWTGVTIDNGGEHQAFIYEFTEAEYNKAKSELAQPIWDALAAMLAGLCLPLEMRRNMPDVFDALVNTLMKQIHDESEGNDDE